GERMSQVAAEALPLSRTQIREFATDIRKMLGLQSVPQVDVAQLVEIILPQVIPDFYLDVRTMEEMGNKHGEANPSEKMICLRDDVYDGVVRGVGRDRLTALHEVGHVLLHTPDRIVLCRAEGTLARFKDPEWQADCFAGEFLASHLFVGQCRHAEDLSQLTGVSIAAAKVQWNAYMREGLIQR
ncbi:MAG TPA: hypothetical protein VHP34_03270, partial [Alphaproteobacteria bacterium]|nr:hypothetical protein [Alphaproteobacteria bacterium]